MNALCQGPVPMAEVGLVIGWPDDPDRARRVVASMVADGLALETEGFLALP